MLLAFLILYLQFSTSNSAHVVIRHKSVRVPDSQIVNYDESAKCQPLTIPACKRLGYNSTRVPRYSDITSANLEYVALSLRLFQKDACFDNLLFFTCMMYNPICFKNHMKRVLPCKSVCLNVKQQCKGTMNKLGIPWPTELACDNLPDYETDVCIKPNSIITRKNFVPDPTPRVTSNQIDCTKCPKRARLQRFRQFKKSDYAIEAEYLSKTKTSNGNLRLRFKVVKVFKAGNVPLVKHGFVDIWSNSPCLCVNLEYEQKYVILGKEYKTTDSVEPRMVLTPKTIIVKKNYLWRRTLRKWKRKYRHMLERRARELLKMQTYDELSTTS